MAIPDPPPWLQGPAVEEWARITPELERLGLVTHLDRAILTMYVEAYADFVTAQRDILARGRMLRPTKPGGKPVVNPSDAIVRRSITHLLAIARECGMTPSARARLTVERPAAPPSKSVAEFEQRYRVDRATGEGA